MEIVVNYKYEEEYIPPRCRKPRYRDTQASFIIDIPVLSPAQAPIAFRHEELHKGMIEYRLIGDKLYTRVRWSNKRNGTNGWWPADELIERMGEENTWSCVRDYDIGPIHSPVECEKVLKAKYGCYIFIQSQDGELEVWELTGEPRYVIVTFGLGHNHASTNYFIETHYNPNICKERYFTALQYDKVVQETLHVAAARGDTNSFDSIKRGPKIEVLIPEAVHCKPAEEAGDGDPFQNMLEAITSGSSSSGEAAAVAIAATLLGRR